VSKLRTVSLLTTLAVIVGLLPDTVAQQIEKSPALGRVQVMQLDDGAILATDGVDSWVFENLNQYVLSDFFVDHGLRCGASSPLGPMPPGYASTADCSSSFTNPASQYAPAGGATYQIPVVVHVITHKNGSGFISDAMVESQIDILNEDFSALPGSNGAPGTDTNVEFFLATTDPSGNPTNGITRHENNKWFNDQQAYYNAIGWDTTRYLNIYTNLAGGNLGYAYVPSGGGVVGQNWDGVRILWSSFGANAPIGPPYNLGRTTTHEVGHYLGLYHTFDGGCVSTSGCNGNGDLICDTNPEASPNGFPCDRVTCGSSDPTHNYLDYSDDICMYEFTEEQTRRMRCTLENFRVDLPFSGTVNAAPSVSISAPSNGTSVVDGTPLTFTASASDPEDGNLSGSISWSSSRDGALGTGASVGATLSVGSHTITASVTDSGGKSGSDSISVNVTPIGGGISLSTSHYKQQGRVVVELVYTGATTPNVDVYMNGGYIGTVANTGFATHNTGLKGGGSLTYQVCEEGGGPCSNESVVNY
jgi:hypothetical protein